MKAIIYILLFWSITNPVYAQDPYYTKIDASKGLPSNFVYSIYKDSKGFMWFATNDGLCKYDGLKFITYYNREQTSKAGSLIKEDRFGRIWYENFDGFLYYVENEKLISFKHGQPLAYMEYGLFKDIITVIEKNGATNYDLKSLKKINTIAFDPYSFSGVCQQENRIIVFAKEAFAIDNGCKKNSLNIQIENDSIRKGLPGLAASLEHKTFFYNTKYNPRFCFVMENDTIKTAFELSNKNFVQNLCAGKSALWFCSTSGVHCYDIKTGWISPPEAWYKNININCVYQTNEGYWIGTAGRGLMFVRDLNTCVYFNDHSFTKLEIADSTLLLGTKNKGIYSFDPSKSSLHNIIENMDFHSIDLLKYKPGSRRIYYTTSCFNITDLVGKKNVVLQMSAKDIEFLDDNYTAVAASGLIGIIKNDETNKSTYEAFCIRRSDKHSNTYALLDGIRGKSLAKYTNDDGFYCASNLGLYYFKSGTSKEIKNKGKSVYLSKVEVIGDHLLGLATNGTLWEINKSNQFNCIDSTGSVRSFYYNNAFLSIYKGSSIEFYETADYNKPKLLSVFNVSNEQVNDIKYFNENIYLATDNGLLKINSKIFNAPDNKVHFYINYLGTKDSIYYNKEFYLLNPFENDIEISYSLVDYINREKHSLQYRINNGDWKDLPLSSNVLSLASLSGGDYEIKFKLDNEILSNTLLFTIHTPWWKQWWFVFLCFSLLIGLVVIYYRWQANELKKKNSLLIQKIELEKDLNQSILTSIKAQMNPHFFYNALNTIQSFIFTDDKKNASNYLTKFSKLTRIILEMSEKPSVTLQEEIDALLLYLELEKVRFNNELQYHIHHAGVPIEMINIPSMIIQPFVENALKHGLLHKKGEKILNIDIYVMNAILNIIIDDNGIGRKRSAELNKIKNTEHKSFSTSANTKRLEILNAERSAKVGIEIIDKYSGEKAEGTKVIIQIPI